MKVGDYVRTKSGGIGKTIEIDNNASCSHIITDNETFGLGWDGEQVNWDFITEIVKSSPNIIDLIEEGDYVKYNNKASFYKVCDLLNEKIIVYGKNFGDWVYINSDDVKIKSIVTKEQFEAMEYRIGE